MGNWSPGGAGLPREKPRLLHVGTTARPTGTGRGVAGDWQARGASSRGSGLLAALDGSGDGIKAFPRSGCCGRWGSGTEEVASSHHVKKAALEEPEKPAEVQPDARPANSCVCDDDKDGKKFDGGTAADPDLHRSCDQHKSSGIESTPAEAEALSKELQTIKNDDLGEIKELGSGTYGSVFHGKWRGCDVMGLS
ncbi:hypothetical protein ZWY2020_034564 [Hordeum vulgare]|nr:hypothetical protein ZWY2020_034564 [Hordeum vulgare]